MSETIDSLKPWCDKPVAVQLRVPVILVECARDDKMEPMTVNGLDDLIYGVPRIVVENGQVEHSNMLIGVIKVIRDRAVVSVRLPSGVRTDIAFKPELIDYITLVTEVPQISRIVQ